MDSGQNNTSQESPPVARTQREIAGYALKSTPLNPFEQKALDVRIEATRSAQERTRRSFFASTVISLVIITAGWNAYFSFYREFAFAFPSLEGGEGTKTLQKEMLSEWVRSRMINISILGIRVGVDDAPTLGAIAHRRRSMALLLHTAREPYDRTIIIRL